MIYEDRVTPGSRSSADVSANVSVSKINNLQSRLRVPARHRFVFTSQSRSALTGGAERGRAGLHAEKLVCHFARNEFPLMIN